MDNNDTIETESCRTLVKQVGHMIGKIENKIGATRSYETRARKKRGAPLEFLGRIDHYMRGIMDADSAREYTKLINEIGNATEIIQ